MELKYALFILSITNSNARCTSFSKNILRLPEI